MAKNKIIIKKNIKDDFMIETNDIDSISLVVELKNKSSLLRKIDLGKHLINLSKEEQLKRRKEFVKIIAFTKNTRRSSSTISNIIQRINTFIRISDENEILFFENKTSLLNALKNYKNIMKEKVSNKETTLASVNTFRSQIFSFLIDCFAYEEKELQQYYPKINQRTGKLKNATILDSSGEKTVYTKEEYKKLLLILMGLSKHCDFLIKNNIKKTSIKDYPFKLENYMYKFRFKNNNSIKDNLLNSKSIFLLFSFIALTGANLTPVLLAKRKDIKIIKGERDLLHLTLTCNRKSKIQEHKFILKKYQKQFFNYIIEHSNLMDINEEASLFPYIEPNTLEKTNLNDNIIQDYYKKIVKDSEIKVNLNTGIKITSRALRLTYASFFADLDLRSAALFNSLETAAKHYSDGNFKESNNNLQQAMNIYTIALKENEKISIIKDNIIDIKQIEDYKGKDIKLSSNGLFCVNSSNSSMEQKFKRRMNKSGILNDKISCANILACFQCENAMLSESFETVYLLLSLKNYLNESIYDNECSGLFGDAKIVKETIININLILDKKIKSNLIKEVNLFIKKNDYHPLWQKL
jgi:hypothetical protein